MEEKQFAKMICSWVKLITALVWECFASIFKMMFLATFVKGGTWKCDANLSYISAGQSMDNLMNVIFSSIFSYFSCEDALENKCKSSKISMIMVKHVNNKAAFACV